MMIALFEKNNSKIVSWPLKHTENSRRRKMISKVNRGPHCRIRILPTYPYIKLMGTSLYVAVVGIAMIAIPIVMQQILEI